jgi:hypothetical protein
MLAYCFCLTSTFNIPSLLQLDGDSSIALGCPHERKEPVGNSCVSFPGLLKDLSELLPK